MSWMAFSSLNQGRWTEAEKLFVQVVETSMTVLKPEHPNTLTSMDNYLPKSGTMDGGGKTRSASDGNIQESDRA